MSRLTLPEMREIFEMRPGQLQILADWLRVQRLTVLESDFEYHRRVMVNATERGLLDEYKRRAAAIRADG